MNKPEIAVAHLSFATFEFEAVKAAVENLQKPPDQAQIEKEAEMQERMQSIQRAWRGISEEDIPESAERRRMLEEIGAAQGTAHYNGTVIVGLRSVSIRGNLVSEHPVIAAARDVIKFGPPVTRVPLGSMSYFQALYCKNEGAEDGSDDVPDEIYDQDTCEIPDYSKGTGLSMQAMNIRTGRVALSATELPPLEGEPGFGFDIGFTMDPSLERQDVDVMVLERTYSIGSEMQPLLLEKLAHLRQV